MVTLTYPKTVAAALKSADTVLLVAPQQAFAAGWHKKALPKGLAKRTGPLAETKAGPLGTVVTSVDDSAPKRLVAGVLPDAGSRHNTPARTEAVWNVARGACLSGKCAVVCALDEASHAQAVAIGIARTQHLFDATSGPKTKTSIAIVMTDAKGHVVPVSKRTREVVGGVRDAARLVDTPTADLTTADFVREAKKIVRGLPNVTSKVIIGDALAKQGLGGVYGVGKAAAVAPRMLILDYKPARAKRTVALVGKGVVYDTGGLHIKGRGSMESMKGDMGGAAAVIGAFRVLAASKAKVRVIAITPLAENSVDANSYRPDDILTMHSGHTVEINNTDAEGRLLLGDAVSWAARKVKPDVIIDIATLTGAQLIATGKSHAAVVSDRDGLQDLACEVGRATGELCFPLLFCPEFHHREFKSQVADMKNSVKDRMNAQSSCAAWFVWSHIDDLTVPWLHIDIAGPGWRDDRGTGFGVGLLAGLAESIRAEHLA